MQEQKEDNGIVEKSNLTTMNLSVCVSTSSPTVNSLIASKSLEILKALCRTDGSSSGKPDARNSNHDATSSSHGWQKDAVLDVGMRKLVATEEDQEHLKYSEDSVGTGKLVALGYQGYPGIPGDSGDSEAEGNDKDWPHQLHISPNDVQHMETVFSLDCEAKIWSQPDGSSGPDVNSAACGICHTSSRSSSWTSLFEKLTICQESTLEVCVTVISND